MEIKEETRVEVPYYIKKTQELVTRNREIAEDFRVLASSVQIWPERAFIEYNQNINLMEKLSATKPLTFEEFYGDN